MATPAVSLRLPPALLALIDAAATAAGASRTDVILDALQEAFAPVAADAAPRSAKVAPAAPRGQGRDIAPKIGAADTAGSAPGGGMVSRMGGLPLGNSRPPYQKGQGAQGKGKR